MLDEKLNLLIKNSDILDDVKGVYEENILKKLNALNLTLRGKVANKSRIEEAVKLIEMKTVWPSEFRGSNLMTLAVNISTEEDMDKALKGIEDIYNKLREEGLPLSKYLMLAAQSIYFGRHCINLDKTIKNTKLAYEEMKKNHRFETKKENLCAAAIIAMNSIDIKEDFKEINECYTVLTECGFKEGNSLQLLSNVLSFVNLSTDLKAAKVRRLNKSFKENKVALKNSSLPILGVAAFVTDDYDELSMEVLDLADKLEFYSGFKSVTVDSEIRNLIALILLISKYREGLDGDLRKVILKENKDNTKTLLVSTQLAAALGGEISISEIIIKE